MILGLFGKVIFKNEKSVIVHGLFGGTLFKNEKPIIISGLFGGILTLLQRKNITLHGRINFYAFTKWPHKTYGVFPNIATAMSVDNINKVTNVDRPVSN